MNSGLEATVVSELRRRGFTAISESRHAPSGTSSFDVTAGGEMPFEVSVHIDRRQRVLSVRAEYPAPIDRGSIPNVLSLLSRVNLGCLAGQWQLDQTEGTAWCVTDVRWANQEPDADLVGHALAINLALTDKWLPWVASAAHGMSADEAYDIATA